MAEFGFSLLGVDTPQGQDPLGIWDVVPGAAKDGPVAYGLESTLPEEPTWRVSLPAAPQQAMEILHAREASVEHSLAGLADIQRSLDGFSQIPSYGGEAYAPQKDALRDTLARYQAATQTTDITAYSLGDLFKRREEQDEQRGLQAQWEGFVQQVQQVVRDYVRIETALDARLVAVTRVSWGGDFKTFWDTGVPTQARGIHRESLKVALDSRIALLRVIAVVATGAVGLAVKASIPGGQVLLLPATWQYVRDVLAELRRV